MGTSMIMCMEARIGIGDDEVQEFYVMVPVVR